MFFSFILMSGMKQFSLHEINFHKINDQSLWKPYFLIVKRVAQELPLMFYSECFIARYTQMSGRKSSENFTTVILVMYFRNRRFTKLPWLYLNTYSSMHDSWIGKVKHFQYITLSMSREGFLLYQLIGEKTRDPYLLK